MFYQTTYSKAKNESSSTFMATWMRSPNQNPEALSLHVNRYIFITTEQTPSVDEDHAIQLKTPEKAIKQTLSWNRLV